MTSLCISNIILGILSFILLQIGFDLSAIWMMLIILSNTLFYIAVNMKGAE